MTQLRITGGGCLRATMRVPGDKSISHRALLLSALAEGVSSVRGLSPGADVACTRAAVEAIGAEVSGERIAGGRERLHEPETVIGVGNSGTTIRLMAGLCAGFDWLSVFHGDASVSRRPMDRVAEPLRLMGASVDGRDGGRFAPLVVRGARLEGIDYSLPVASAQVKSSVLLASVAAEVGCVVRERRRTRAHTEEMLAAMGADISSMDQGDGRIVTLKPSVLSPLDLEVPGDPSAAAYWLVAAAIVEGSEVVVENLYLGPGRAGFLAVLDRMGAQVELVGPSGVRVRSSPLASTDINGGEVPGLIDEIPVLAVAAAVADGVTVIAGAGELRVKESDRAATMTEGLTAMGAKVEMTDDGMVISGGRGLTGAEVSCHGDHRVAMALAVAALVADGETVIDGWEAVATSYPGFEEELARWRR